MNTQGGLVLFFVKHRKDSTIYMQREWKWSIRLTASLLLLPTKRDFNLTDSQEEVTVYRGSQLKTKRKEVPENTTLNIKNIARSQIGLEMLHPWYPSRVQWCERHRKQPCNILHLSRHAAMFLWDSCLTRNAQTTALSTISWSQLGHKYPAWPCRNCWS